MRVREGICAAALAAMTLLAGSCREEQPTQKDDEARLASMRADIESMVGTPSCGGDAAQCAYVAFGSKPCGGPWRYLIYSKSRTDAAALEKKVADYNRFEDAVNKRWGKVSDCMAVAPPRLGCVDGTCKNLDGPP
jgi:hypothetical protein